VFWALLSSSEHSGVPEDSKSPTFPSVGLHPHTWPKWGCDTNLIQLSNFDFVTAIVMPSKKDSAGLWTKKGCVEIIGL